ncbi:MAG: MmgE/PrpD family protein [Dehalococcoidia bacterium]
MPQYLDTLSEFVSTTSFEDLDAEAVGATKDVVMDTVGAIVAGNRLPENIKLGNLIAERSGHRTATILGTAHRAEPMMATLVNSTIGVSFEMDEGNRFGAGHPSIHSMPGVLAVAEELGASGRRFMEAFVVGYEVETRIGRATRSRPGVHSHGHWGAVATAAGIARLKGYDPAETREVMNIAASMAPANTWTPCFEGATIRNAYPGRSGLQGVLAHYMHECGFTGVADGLTDVYGTIIGDHFDQDAVVAGLGSEPYRIQQNYFKFYACCRINHPPLDAVRAARDQASAFDADEVDAVEVFTSRRLEDGPLAGMVGPYPPNMLSAKFNIPYAVAAVLDRGSADITAFFPEAIQSERMRSLASKVKVDADPSLAGGRDSSGPIARAVIRLKDGRELRGDTQIVHGDWGNRAPREELIDKFKFITSGPLDGDRADGVIATIDRLEELDDVRELTRQLGGQPG